MKASKMACWVVIALAALQLAHAWVVLPDTVASHFGGGGRADDFSSKTTFVVIMAVVIAVTALIALAITPAVRGIPDDLISLPNKDHWLAPERRNETFEALGDLMAWFGVATLILLVVVNHLVIEANQTAQPRLDETVMWVLMGGYFAFVAGWLVWLFRRFGRPG